MLQLLAIFFTLLTLIVWPPPIELLELEDGLLALLLGEAPAPPDAAVPVISTSSPT